MNCQDPIVDGRCGLRLILAPLLAALSVGFVWRAYLIWEGLAPLPGLTDFALSLKFPLIVGAISASAAMGFLLAETEKAPSWADVLLCGVIGFACAYALAIPARALFLVIQEIFGASSLGHGFNPVMWTFRSLSWGIVLVAIGFGPHHGGWAAHEILTGCCAGFCGGALGGLMFDPMMCGMFGSVLGSWETAGLSSLAISGGLAAFFLASFHATDP